MVNYMLILETIFTIRYLEFRGGEVYDGTGKTEDSDPSPEQYHDMVSTLK